MNHRADTTMQNPYGVGNTYVTSLAGVAVTLARLRYDANLNNSAAGAVRTQTSFDYSRVEMLYSMLLK